MATISSIDQDRAWSNRRKLSPRSCTRTDSPSAIAGPDGFRSLMSAKEPVVLSWSGGKDSAMALYELRRGDAYEVVSLLTTVSEEFRRISRRKRSALHCAKSTCPLVQAADARTK